MDSKEYTRRRHRIFELAKRGHYQEATKEADQIDWAIVQNTKTIEKISLLYLQCRRYEEGLKLLEIIFGRDETDLATLKRICAMTAALGQKEKMLQYYDKFLKLESDKLEKKIMKYRILKAMDIEDTELIKALEAIRAIQYQSKWAYELAEAYARVGREEDGIRECCRIIEAFAADRYTQKADDLRRRLGWTETAPEEEAEVEPEAKPEALPEEESEVEPEVEPEALPEEEPAEEDEEEAIEEFEEEAEKEAEEEFEEWREELEEASIEETPEEPEETSIEEAPEEPEETFVEEASEEPEEPEETSVEEAPEEPEKDAGEGTVEEMEEETPEIPKNIGIQDIPELQEPDQTAVETHIPDLHAAQMEGNAPDMLQDRLEEVSQAYTVFEQNHQDKAQVLEEIELKLRKI